MDRYAVVGNPIAHSKSPEIHALFAQQTGQSMSYEKMLVELGQFDSEVQAFFANGGEGLNVTVPFKEDAYGFADKLTPRAQLAGAVNTLIRQTDGSILGDTTDGAGLVEDIRRQGWALEHQRVLVLGAGGAVRGVIQPLLEKNVASLTIANRTLSKAQRLSELFANYGAVNACTFEQTVDRPFDLIINGTSAGLAGTVPALPAAALDGIDYVYDMIYSSDLTDFLRWAVEHGVPQSRCCDGLGMLVGQAAESFFLWRGIKPECEPVIEVLREQLR